MKKIPIKNKSIFAIVDDDMFEELSKKSWFLGTRGYAYTSTRNGKKAKNIAMHRIVNQTPLGVLTDHINGNKLDNRRENLRVANQSQNQANRPAPSYNKSGYKGVSFAKKNKSKPWTASIRENGKKKWLGDFSTKEEAAKVYNAKAKELWGEFAYQNII